MRDVFVVTPVFAAVLALMFVVLSIRVNAFRRSARVGLGDGGNLGLLRRMRAHGNFAEYVPFGLVLMALAEAQNCRSWTIHALGLALVIGRVLHAIGVTTEPEMAGLFRVAGMGLTFTVLTVAALLNLGPAVGLSLG